MSTTTSPLQQQSGAALSWYDGEGGRHGKICEQLLSSDAWQNSNPYTHEGTMARFELMSQAGLRPMRVIPASKIAELKRIPCSYENFQVDAREALREKYGGIIIFFSQRWLRGDWCEAAKKNLKWNSPEREQYTRANYVVGDPDSADHEKAIALIEIVKWLQSETPGVTNSNQAASPGQGTAELGALFGHTWKQIPSDLTNIFFWIDYCCVDQCNDMNKGMDMAALPACVALSNYFVAYWNSEYASRAWCQVELMLTNSYATNCNIIHLTKGFRYDESLKYVSAEWLTVPDPRQGLITSEDDRPVVSSLTLVANNSQTFTCMRTFQRHSALHMGGLVNNIFCFCQCFGLGSLYFSRNVTPGSARICKLTPCSYSFWPWLSSIFYKSGYRFYSLYVGSLVLLCCLAVGIILAKLGIFPFSA